MAQLSGAQFAILSGRTTGPRKTGPGAQLSGAQFATLWGRTVRPWTTGPRGPICLEPIVTQVELTGLWLNMILITVILDNML